MGSINDKLNKLTELLLKPEKRGHNNEVADEQNYQKAWFHFTSNQRCMLQGVGGRVGGGGCFSIISKVSFLWLG